MKGLNMSEKDICFCGSELKRNQTAGRSEADQKQRETAAEANTNVHSTDLGEHRIGCLTSAGKTQAVSTRTRGTQGCSTLAPERKAQSPSWPSSGSLTAADRQRVLNVQAAD